MNQIRQFFSTLKSNRSWLALTVIFFAGGTFLMYSGLRQEPELWVAFEEAFMPFFQEMGQEVFSGHPIRGIAILFLNNFIASFNVIILGLFLGIIPLFSSLANGAMLGAVAFKLVQEGIAPVPYLLAGIVPHGIFELPAFFVSAAFGLKLGYHIVFPAPQTGRLKTLGNIFREIRGIFPIIVVLLVLAALIEVLFTPYFMQLFY